MFTSHGVKAVRLRHKYQHSASMNAYIYEGTNLAVTSVSFSANTFTTTI